LLDGVNLEDPGSYLRRESLVQKTIGLARQSGLLIVCSPPGTGKTSLIQLVNQNLQDTADEGRSCKGFILRPSRPNKPAFDLFDFVRSRTGVSYEDKTLTTELQAYSEVWLLFDDAQKLYGDQFNDFWEDVVKTRTSIGFGLRTKVVVVVSATYYLTIEADSPVSFQSEPRVGMYDLLLSASEASDLFNLRSLYPGWHDFKAALFYLTNGAAAAFAIGLNLIGDMSLNVDYRIGSLSERAAMEELIEGMGFLDRLSHCFPARSVDANSHKIIFDSIVEAYRVDVGGPSATSIVGVIPINKLKEAGILSNNNRFTSPAAARFYYSKLFPRASLGTEPPESLDQLIIQATSKLSARRLRVSCQKNANGEMQTPKGVVYQQLFHEAISALLPTSYRIIPELGTEALIRGEVKTGELDFYIRNGSKWGLELLRDGDKIGGHLGRIPGKYRNVVADEWLVVDCCIHPSVPKKRAYNRCSLVFSENFRSCQCYLRLSLQPIAIQLME